MTWTLPIERAVRGFADPAQEAQRCFRAIMQAFATPGTVHRLAAEIAAPPCLAPATAIALLTLADHDTPVWMRPALEDGAGYIRFETGAPIAGVPADAGFAVLDGTDGEVPLQAFPAGDDRYPDRSATVLVQCTALVGGVPVRLAGPGIRGHRVIAPSGLHAGFWVEAMANHARYPLGIDLLLVAADEFMALPRSTRPALDGSGEEL